MADTCTKISVESTEVIQTVDQVALILSAVFGLIGGIVIGLLLLLCISKITGRKIGSKPLTAVDNEGFAEDSKTKPIENYTKTPTWSEKPKRKVDTGPPKSKEPQSTKEQFLGLEDIVVDVTWDRMISELGKQELCELMRMEHSLWEERHVCLMQCYRVILNNLLQKRYITESQHSQILTSEDRHLSNSLHEFETNWKREMVLIASSGGQTLLDIFMPLQEGYVRSLAEMVSVYHSSHMRFLRRILVIGDKKAVEYSRETLQYHVDAMEAIFRENQDELNENIHQAFAEFGKVVRDLVVSLLIQSELNRLQTVTCYAALEKLVKAGRISSDTKQKIKELMDVDFNITYDEIKSTFSGMHPEIVTDYKCGLEQHEQHTTEMLQSVLTSYANGTSLDGFLQHYTGTCLEHKTQRLSMLRDLAVNEHAGILDRLHELSQSQSEKRQEQLNAYCSLLADHDALDASETQNMMVDFSAKMKNAQNTITTACKRNIGALWALYERHCTQTRRDENAIGASVLQDIATDNILRLEGFLSVQCQLSDEDKESVLLERESLFLLLFNLVDVYRTKCFQVFENDLAKCQAFLLMKKSEQLVGENMNEILSVIQRLWSERNAMRHYAREISLVSGVKSVIAISNDVMCRVVAGKLVTKTLTKEIARRDESQFLDDVKTKIIGNLALKNSGNHAVVTRDHNVHSTELMRSESERFASTSSMLLEDINATYTKRQGRLKTKFDRISQHSNPLGSTEIQPYLEQLLMQYQIARAIDLVEVEGHQQALTQRQILCGSTVEAMAELNVESEIALLMKLAASAGMTKPEISRCMQMHDEDVGNKAMNNKFLRHWKEAKLYAGNALS